MWKALIIILLVGYLIFKLIGGVFKFMIRSSGASSAHQSRSDQNTNYRKKPSEGNVNIDYVPKNDEEKKKNFNAGEYVDYEEIK